MSFHKKLTNERLDEIIANRQLRSGARMANDPSLKMAVPEPDDDGRPPEAYGKQRPELPSAIAEPDPTVCSRELAFLRQMIAAHQPTAPGEEDPFPVKVELTEKMLMAVVHLRGPNRDPSAAWIGRYAAMQGRPGGWRKTHQHLAFDTDGLMRDGLHRALAGLKSGFVRFGWIWFGVAPDDFAAMDNGYRRSAPQNLKIHGDKHSTLTASVVRLRHRNENKGEMPDDMLVDEIGYSLIDNKLFEEAVTCSHVLLEKVKTNRSSATLAYWLIGEKSARVVRLGTFWGHLAKGAGLPDNNPIWVCREKLIKMSNSKAFRHSQYKSQTAMTAWIIEAWNLWSNGNPVPSQKWPLWNKTHGLPVIDADDSYGTGESHRVIKNRDRTTFAKGRRRTPGNVARAIGMI